MKRKLMASVLLASMAVSMPVFADEDRTPDEYNPDAKYESPLNQSQSPVVNEYRKVQTEDEEEMFLRTAEKLTLGAASGKSAVMKQAELQKAEKQAEKVLSEKDEDFEPVTDKEYPGYEYQAGKQVSSVSGVKSLTDTGSLQGPKNADKILVRENPVLTGEKAVTSDKKGKEKNRAGNLPLVITGDDAQYANESGDFIIEGNVCLQQGLTHLTSTRAVGNAKTGDVWLLDGGTLLAPDNMTHVRWAHYNFNNKTGELLRLKGVSAPGSDKSIHDFYEAPHGVIENGKMILDQGASTTRCPAVRHTPCLSVTAKTITIIPNDRIIARGVKVFVKGKHIYSRDVWINDLKNKKNTISPRIGWKDDKGWYVALDYEHPIGNPLLKNPTTFSMRQVYYTKSHYKPFYSIRHDQKDFYVRFNDGYVYDSDNDLIDDGIWLHKKTDWGLFVKPHRIAKGIPLTYDAGITHGLWKYTNESWSSWHTETAVHLRHDRIHLFGGKKMYLDLMLGHKWVKESLDNEVTREHGKSLDSDIYLGTIGYRFSDKWNIWETFHHENKTSYLFSLGQPDFSREWRTGIAWTPDDRNTVTIVNRHNSDSSSWSHGNYSTTFTWSHRFCCEGLTVSYARKHYKHDNEWTVKFDLFNW